MPFNEELPEWKKDNPDTKPAQSKLDAGWVAGEKPPASMWNWFANRTYRALKQLFENAIHKDTLGQPGGPAKLGSNGKLEAGQENTVTIPDATTSVKGITMLSNGVSGTSQTKAGTELAVKDAKEAAINFAKGFGLGALAKRVDNVDVNTIASETGFYYVQGTSTNKPVGTNGYLVVYAYAAGYAIQTFVTIAGVFYTRALNGGTWGPWTEQETTTGAQAKAKAAADAVNTTQVNKIADNSKSGTTPLTDFQDGLTVMSVNSTTINFPTQFGTLETRKAGLYGYQVFTEATQGTIYFRNFNPNTKIWGAWARQETTANKNQPNGYVGLGPDNKINPAQLPEQTRLELEYLKINYSNF